MSTKVKTQFAKNDDPKHSLNDHSLDIFIRATILFAMGSMSGLVLNLLQIDARDNSLTDEFVYFLKYYWYYLPMCGLAAVYIGFLYPFFDHKFGECHHNDREWTLIIRCVALFVGLNHLCAVTLI
jgi:hypothetical protein